VGSKQLTLRTSPCSNRNELPRTRCSINEAFPAQPTRLADQNISSVTNRIKTLPQYPEGWRRRDMDRSPLLRVHSATRDMDRSPLRRVHSPTHVWTFVGKGQSKNFRFGPVTGNQTIRTFQQVSKRQTRQKPAINEEIRHLLQMSTNGCGAVPCPWGAPSCLNKKSRFLIQ
jgi:hypothetical protein